MPRQPSTANKHKTNEELALGRGNGTFTPKSLRTCQQPQCYYTTKTAKGMELHDKARHVQCPIDGCHGRYTAGQKPAHLVRSHDIRPVESKQAFGCRYVGCGWSGKAEEEREKHEEENHVDCDVMHCDWRGARKDFLRHEHVEHDPTDPRLSKSLAWTPAEQAVLDFIWLKHQNFNDTLDILLELFPHRISTGDRPTQNITRKLLDSQWRYENMDMTLKGEDLVEHLKSRGLLD